MPSAKTTYQLASTSFLKREYQQSIVHASALLSLLPPAPYSTWAVELRSPKARLAEKWRAQATALIVSASAIDWKASHSVGQRSEEEDELWLEALTDRVRAAYTSPASPNDPVLPPSIVQNLVLATASLDIPNPAVRALCESYLASIPGEVMGALAEAVSLEDEPKSWWMQEALEGYQTLMELYLVDVLVNGTNGGDAERAEARKLVEWTECLTKARKERILERLVEPPAPPPELQLLSQNISSTTISSRQPPQPLETPLEAHLLHSGPFASSSIVSERHFSAYTSPRPSSPSLSDLSAPSPAPASIVSRLAASLCPPYSPRLHAVGSPIVLFALLWWISRDRARLMVRSRKAREWLVRLIRAIWRDLVWTSRLATSITYV